jgi:hypothetical protein
MSIREENASAFYTSFEEYDFGGRSVDPRPRTRIHSTTKIKRHR